MKCDYLFMKKQNEVIDNLIETLKDGQEGFKQAAESVRNPALKTLFSDYSQQRSRFATALQSEARSHGETKPETSSSATGALHRGWINLKSAITGGDEHAILAECERGEDSAVEEYKKALTTVCLRQLRSLFPVNSPRSKRPMTGSKACVTQAKANCKRQLVSTTSRDVVSNRVLPDKTTIRPPDGVFQSESLSTPI